jgi:tetratricopeptide (TPR) repeat protein
MYEAGHWRETLGLINIALDACEGKNDLARSHLLNTAAMTHFYLNDLAQCREALAESRTIREALYDMVDEELANTYLNYGNLEGAEGKEDEAIVYFERSIAIRRNIANAEVMIAVCHLTIARALLNKGDYDGCEVWMDKSEKAFVEKLGEQAHNLLL